MTKTSHMLPQIYQHYNDNTCIDESVFNGVSQHCKTINQYLCVCFSDILNKLIATGFYLIYYRICEIAIT